MRIEYRLSKMVDDHGMYDDEGVYFELLLPCMDALAPTTDAEPDDQALTETQTCLGLAGIAHLEILNGGVPQMTFNWPDHSSETPTALASLGFGEAASALTEAMALSSLEGDTRNSRAEELDVMLGDLVQSQQFYVAIVRAAADDPVGFVALD